MRILTLVLLLVCSPLHAGETWRVVGDEQFAPYSFVTMEDDTPHGVDVELIRAIMQAGAIDYQLRLYDRRRGRWTGKLVHESVKVDGTPVDLSGELQHYAYRNLSHHLQTMDRYTTLAARQMRDDGRTAGWFDLALHPPAAFVRNYVLRGGFRDGLAGLVISTLNATYVALKFAKLWELCSHSTSTRPAPGAADSSKSS